MPIRSCDPVHLQVPCMFPNLIFSYSGWFSSSQSLPLPPVTRAVYVAGTLAGEDQGKNVIEYLSLLCVPGNHISCFLPEMDHIFPNLSLIHQGTYRSFSCCPLCPWPDLILSGFSFPDVISGSSDIFCITSRLPVLASTLCRLPSFV